MFCPEIPLANASFTYSPCGPFTQKQTKKKNKTNKQTNKKIQNCNSNLGNLCFSGLYFAVS